ncbi:Uncharacterised protein [Pseudomonas fluorescens]|uniref:Uncharacterized protein n=1 Tax=Pseudomonas fluorescens TaxID=294 RepID=A0A448DVG4_PSEFL|nr:Uncharacterised protein [Pseudomonas fluorescens]
MDLAKAFLEGETASLKFHKTDVTARLDGLSFRGARISAPGLIGADDTFGQCCIAQQLLAREVPCSVPTYTANITLV